MSTSLPARTPSLPAISTLQTNDNQMTNMLVIHNVRIKSELTWTQLIHAEIIAVTSAMRKNARWSGTNVSGLHMGGLGMSMGLRKGKSHAQDRDLKNEENPLMAGFTSLRTYLEDVQDVKDLDALVLLNPFLEVIRSGSTTGPIAGTALGSVEKFLHYGIVGLHNPSIAFAMNALSSAATHCKFEASDAASDELVLLRMLQVLQATLTSECGQVLSDEAVCEMMETGLSMCCQMRLTDMLRRSAEHVMMKMVISIFERLKTLEDEWQLVDTPTEPDNDVPAETPTTHAPHMSPPKPSPSPSPSPPNIPPEESGSDNVSNTVDGEGQQPETQQPPETAPVDDTRPITPPPLIEAFQHEERNDRIEDTQQNQDQAPLRPYGLPAIRELLRVLISLVNPHEHKHTDSMRMMALGILNVAFEVGGRSISRFEGLCGLVTDEFCKFLFQQLNKKSLGEYLGKKDNFDLLQVFMRQFNFEGKRMDEALRMVLETFRLPGESQQIIRVTDTFSDVYFESKPEGIANGDASQILAYSIIMLNTDQHNPQVRRRMTLEDYMRNLRGVNGNADFSKDYLRGIYEAIRQDEIVMPEEHEGRLGFNYAWKQLLHRSASSASFVVCDTSSYDKAMFEMSWKPAIAAISYAFNTAQDDATLQKAISGFHQCAMLSAHFELYDVFDSIVVNLATMTGLLDMSGHSNSLPDPIVDVAGEKYVISSLAVRFGRNYKAQLAAVVAFTIVTRHGNSLRNGWTKILQVIRNLFLNSLLPHSMLQVEDFLSGTTSIPLKPKNIAPSRQQPRRDGSLLSTLSSYLLSPYSNDETYRADPTEEEVESTMCAVDCVAACRLEELFNDISNLEMEPLQALMTAIGKVGYDHEAVKNAETTIPYDPATVLFLEFMITITIRNHSRIDLLWPYATGYIFEILEHAEKQSVLVVERTVVGLLRLCIRIAAKDKMQDDILKCLQLLRDFPPSVVKAVAEQLMAGIYNLSSANSENLNNAEFLNTILEIKQKVASSL
ncbi:hypothetical protein [Absidia glauca]|uniref:SEC7 domain-containing protein n=1 Tax=Absidia glauca TaxID=4829 RepID=A0A163JGY2_ABSGL|nr:hypothetical protein [Absidia glauca]